MNPRERIVEIMRRAIIHFVTTHGGEYTMRLALCQAPLSSVNTVYPFPCGDKSAIMKGRTTYISGTLHCPRALFLTQL